MGKVGEGKVERLVGGKGGRLVKGRWKGWQGGGGMVSSGEGCFGGEWGRLVGVGGKAGWIEGGRLVGGNRGGWLGEEGRLVGEGGKVGRA